MKTMRIHNAIAKFVLFACLFTLSLYVIEGCSMETKNDSPISSGSIFALSTEEIESLSKSALSGDAEAAFRLYQYFSFSHHDEGKAMYWTGIAAKNGSSVGQYNFAFMLRDSGDFKEALYWANILKSRNYPDSDYLIESINEKMKENPGK